MAAKTEIAQEQGDTASTQRPFKILAIDGGGFKGLYSACLLTELERRFGPIGEHFDMLCGTSTGGLIVLPLSLGKPMMDVVNFYKSYGPRIFPARNRFSYGIRWGRFLFYKSRYDSKALREGLNGILGNARMGDARNILCIPSFSATRSFPRVFKTDHDGQLNRDNALLMTDVGLATAAAPVYFPIAECMEEHSAHRYVDGGLWANNPSLVGLVEAHRFFVGPGRPFDSVKILSVAQVTAPTGRLSEKNYHLLRFGGELIEWMMEGQGHGVDLTFKFLFDAFRFPVEYVRLSAPPLSAKQQKGVNLDVATKTAIETLCELGSQKGHEYKADPDVAAFFAEKAQRRNP